MNPAWWMQSAMLNTMVTQWLWFTPLVRRSVLIGALIIVLVSVIWAHSQPSEQVVTPEPIVSEPLATLAAMSLSELHRLTETWPDVAITTQQERYSLQMPATWAQLYALAAAVSVSAHHADSYKLHWSDSINEHAEIFSLAMQLRPGHYRVSTSESVFTKFISHAPEIVEASSPQACSAPQIPALELLAVWPSRDMIQLVTAQGTMRLKVHQLLDSTWQLVGIGRDFIEFSWQDPDPFCPAKVFTVAI